MSELNKDKEVIQEGRKNRLKGVDAPLRDQIVDKLFDKLEEMGVGQKVVSMWDRHNSERTIWLERQQTYLANWDEHLIGDTNGSFAGSSNLHIPTILTVMKTMHARFVQALWPSAPSLHTKARNEASIPRVPTVQDTMHYSLTEWCNYGQGAEKVVDDFVWDWLSGAGVLKQRWDVKYTRFVDVEKVQVAGAPRFEITPDGREVAIPTTKLVDKEVAKTKKCFEGPVMELVDPEDIAIIGGAGDPQLADAVLHFQPFTASELWTLADRKIFQADKVEAVIEGGPDTLDGEIGQGIKQQRARNAGATSADTDLDLDRYSIIEAYLKLDVDGSGINSDVVVWVHKRSRELLRATYLYRINRRGERPFAKADFMRRKGQEWPVGLPELLYPLAKEMDAIHNMRVDWGMLSTMPFGFYRPTSGIDPEEIELRPGMLIPADNPQTDVFFPNLGNRTVFGFQEENAIQSMIERLTSISDVNYGVMGGSQGVTRTASGARMLNNEMSSNLDVLLRRLNRGWKQALRYHFHMLQERMPPGLSFRVTGDTGHDFWRTVKDTHEIYGDFDFDLSPNSATSNQGLQQEIASQVMQQVADPLAIQLGIVTPAQYYEAKKNLFQSFGIKDFGKYLRKPEGPTEILTPVAEADRVLIGMDVPVSPEMDHEGFLKFFEMVLKDEYLNGQFNQQQILALAAQAKKHQMMMEALAQIQAQRANAQQMQMNAAQSQQQTAPVGNAQPQPA